MAARRAEDDDDETFDLPAQQLLNNYDVTAAVASGNGSSNGGGGGAAMATDAKAGVFLTIPAVPPPGEQPAQMTMLQRKVTVVMRDVDTFGAEPASPGGVERRRANIRWVLAPGGGADRPASVMLEIDDAVKPEKTLKLDKLFIQMGDDVKKVSFSAHPPLKPALRALFQKKFNFSIDVENQDEWPAMYMKEPGEDTFYELEDFGSITEKCTIKLKISATGEDDPRQKYGKGTTSTSAIKRIMNEMSAIKEVVLNGTRDADTKRKIAEALLAKQKELAKEKRHGNMEAWKQQDQTIKELRKQLLATRQMHADFAVQSQAALAQIRTNFRRIGNSGDAASMDPDRMHLNRVKGLIAADSTQLKKSIAELKKRASDLVQDVSVRRSFPSEAVLVQAWKDLDAVRTQLDTHADRFNKESKQAWKRQWEKELNQVVQEQKYLKEQELQSDELDEVFAELEESWHAVALTIKQSAKTKATFIMPELPEGIDPTDVRDGMLKQITAIKVDSTKRLNAAEEAAKKRAEAAVDYKPKWVSELGAFVSDKKLRNKGGFEEADRIRRERDLATLKGMMTSSSASATTAPDTTTAPGATTAPSTGPSATTTTMSSTTTAPSTTIAPPPEITTTAAEAADAPPTADVPAETPATASATVDAVAETPATATADDQ